MKACLCLGSNLNNPIKQLEKAVKYLGEKCYINIIKAGDLISTKPFGYKEQPDFANQLLLIDTPLSARELLIFIKKTEKELGRIETFKWGPRSIDIDIILYEDEIINEEHLKLPHPGIMEREFLLKMLAEMMPDYIHPVEKKTISTLLSEYKSKEAGKCQP